MLAGFDAKPLKRESRSQGKRAGFGLPSGVYMPFGGTTAPAGFLLCNGQAVSRKSYPELFAQIGTTWGAGDGSTTFNVPNLVDRVPIGAGNLYSAAGTGGSKDAIAVSHNHTYSGTSSSDGAHQHTIDGGVTVRVLLPFVGGGGNYGAGPASTADLVSVDSAGAHTHTYSGNTSTDGSSGTNANLPPYVATHWIIKT